MTNFQKESSRKLIKSIFLANLLFSIIACVPRPDPRWGQIAGAAAVKSEDKVKACQLLAKRTAELSSVRTLANISMNSESGNQTVRLSMVFQAPDKLRFEILPPAAALALYIARSDANGTVLLEPARKKATNIDDPNDLAAKLLKVRMIPQDLAYILAGRIPPGDLARICPLSGNSTAEFFIATDGPGITLFDYDAGQYWTVDMKNGLLRTAMIRRVTDDWPILSADFDEDEFEDNSKLFPSRIELVLGNQAFFASLEPTVVKLNTMVPQSLFEVRVPEGYEIESQ